MPTRIDHATIVTCRDGEPVVLANSTVRWDGGVVEYVGPTAEAGLVDPGLINAPGLKGRPLGRILREAHWVTEDQIDEALERQKQGGAVIGQTLVSLGYVSEQQVEWALAVQAGREPGEAVGPAERVDTIDGANWLIIPGLVNTHHHLYQSLTRCMPSVQSAGLFDWLVGLYPRWQHIDYAAVRHAATISLAELLLGGCTTTSDHMYLFPPESDVRLEAVLEAAETLGIRIHACRGAMSLGKSAGGLPPDACVEHEDRVVMDCERVIALHHDPSPMSMRRIDLAPCAPFNVTPELFDKLRDMAREHGLGLHTHIAETLDEQRFCLDRYGIRPVEYLRRHEWLGDDVYLAHCVHLNEEEIRLFAETGTAVAHCPCSNMRLGSGVAPIRAMLDAGVRVGLAVDGSSSNDGGNLLAEARQAMLLQRAHGGPTAMTPAEAFRLATVGGADVLRRPELGRLEPGAAADFAVYDVRDVAFAGAVAQDPLGALMMCHAPRPARVVVGGRSVLDSGHIAGIDLPQLVSDFNQLVRRRFAGS